VRGGESFTKRETHILQISAGSVDEDDRWVGAGRVLRKAEHRNVQPPPRDLDKLTGWRMRVLQFDHSYPGRSGEKTQAQSEDDE
jgi:hypothetical protein